MSRIPAILLLLLLPLPAAAQTTLRVFPVDGAVLAAGQRFDIRVEASGSPGGEPPRRLTVTLDGRDLTARNILDPGVGGERGRGGTGATAATLAPRDRAAAAPPHTTNFLVRDVAIDTPGRHTLIASTADGARIEVAWEVFAWPGPPDGPRARNVIFVLGDGLAASHRTAARVLARGYTHGKANAPLAMDTMEATGQVMTSSLNAIVTDSAPGMASYSTGNKAANNMEGVYPDNTPDPFDNPRVEYIGPLLRRTRGPGFAVGIVTTADVTDATPAANAIHTADRNAGEGIAARWVDERDRIGLRVLMGGGARHFAPKGSPGSSRSDARDLAAELAVAGFTRVATRTDLLALERGAPPPALLGLFHPRHLPVAFDKVGAGRYSQELAQPAHAGFTDPPMLEEMTRAALRTLEAHAPDGFYLLVEGASIDKQAHNVDAERTIWDIIELDRAIAVALDFARRTNTDDDPANDTLVIVTGDHETGGFAIVGIGNERYAPQTIGRATRDYAAVFRFKPEQVLSFYPEYEPDAQGYPVDPDPRKKLLAGWAAAPDRYENWISNRLARDPAVVRPDGDVGVAVANPARDGAGADSDNRTVDGRPIPGFLVPGVIENGADGCPDPDGCPADTAASPLTIAGHTASDVPLSASGPGAVTFTGTYDNTDVFRRILRLAGR
ncbi:MAG TPA: alkaline phosphatase [Vicinamibacterales bacterium]